MVKFSHYPSAHIRPKGQSKKNAGKTIAIVRGAFSSLSLTAKFVSNQTKDPSTRRCAHPV
uniref:Uncharacterized protein n=1 Tax=Rhizophora mucronata TaxID=61149 RepID=A0A2P2NYQ8_RHIMU